MREAGEREQRRKKKREVGEMGERGYLGVFVEVGGVEDLCEVLLARGSVEGDEVVLLGNAHYQMQTG